MTAGVRFCSTCQLGGLLAPSLLSTHFEQPRPPLWSTTIEIASCSGSTLGGLRLQLAYSTLAVWLRRPFSSKPARPASLSKWKPDGRSRLPLTRPY